MSGVITGRTGAPASRILGFGGYRPARVVTNADICEHIDSSDEWIRERSGIVTRHFAAADEGVVEMSAAAAAKAFAASGVTPDQVDAVIVGTVTHLIQTPSAAAVLADRLGIPDPAAFDISAACRRSAMPERSRIHSSVESICSQISALVTMRAGR